MQLVSIPRREQAEKFKEFYKTSCFTFEGIDLSDKNETEYFKKNFEQVARETGFKEKKLIGYFYTGEDMNRMFHLTEDNAYSNDLTFVSIPGYYNPIVKLKLKARWFNDIVDNNSIRQRAIDGGIEPDFD